MTRATPEIMSESGTAAVLLWKRWTTARRDFRQRYPHATNAELHRLTVEALPDVYAALRQLEP